MRIVLRDRKHAGEAGKLAGLLVAIHFGRLGVALGEFAIAPGFGS